MKPADVVVKLFAIVGVLTIVAAAVKLFLWTCERVYDNNRELPRLREALERERERVASMSKRIAELEEKLAALAGPYR